MSRHGQECGEVKTKAGSSNFGAGIRDEASASVGFPGKQALSWSLACWFIQLLVYYRVPSSSTSIWIWAAWGRGESWGRWPSAAAAVPDGEWGRSADAGSPSFFHAQDTGAHVR